MIEHRILKVADGYQLQYRKRKFGGLFTTRWRSYDHQFWGAVIDGPFPFVGESIDNLLRIGRDFLKKDEIIPIIEARVVT